MSFLGVMFALHQALVVSPTGPYERVADALRAAGPGDTVMIRAGLYREPTIRIDRAVVVLGDSGATLDGEGRRELLVIAAPGVTVRGLTFRNTGRSHREDRAALRVLQTHDCLIAGNLFIDTFFGIYLQGASDCVVTGNRLTGQIGGEGGTGNGIHAWSSGHLTLVNNTITGHRDGIYLEFSRHATVQGNVSTGNRRYGLHFMYSDSSLYLRNRFGANGTGVAVMYSSHVAMVDNDFAFNRGPAAYGLLLKEISRSQLVDNRFEGNTTALVADGANGLEVRGNLFRRNGRAVRLLASTEGGAFTGNAFEGNSFDVVVNSRGITTAFRGNWWDAHRGWDLDRDGISDIPHHPVRLFALLVERSEATMLLQRSLFVRLIDAAERAVPVLTPQNVSDPEPRMLPIPGMER